MFSCLQILEAFLWFVLITLLNVTLIILTLSVSRLLNLLLRLVAFLLFLNPQCLASISRWITASSSWKRFCLFVCRALSSIMVICMLTAIRLLLTFVMSLAKSNQIKQLIRNGRSASLQRTFKKSFTSFSHSTRNKTRDGLIRVRNIRALNGRFNTSITHAYSIVIGSKHITLNATGGGFLTASKQFRHGATSKSRSNTASNSTKHKSPHLSGWRQIISLIT